MEIALDSAMPTYAGGLGVLAGDTAKGETGWAIGESCTMDRSHPDRAACDAAALYDKLERVVAPLFYHDRDRFTDVMRHCISLNGSFFNTQRMVSQYVIKAYFE